MVLLDGGRTVIWVSGLCFSSSSKVASFIPVERARKSMSEAVPIIMLRLSKLERNGFWRIFLKASLYILIL